MNKQVPKITKLARILRRPYYQYLAHVVSTILPQSASVIEFNPKKHGGFKSIKKGTKSRPYDYILITNLFSFIPDVQSFIQKTIRPLSHDRSRVVVISFNYLWKPALDFVTFLGLRAKDPVEPNWLADDDIENMFRLETFELVKHSRGLLFPFNIPLISKFINTFIAPLPPFSFLGLVSTMVFRPIQTKREYSVSILVPARNEEGNIKNLLSRIPLFGTSTEVLFIEGNSRDNTYQAIQDEILRYKGTIQASLYKQKGIGKKDAVELGFAKARHELILILDADLTVDPGELPKFYRALSDGQGELIIGTRLVYPMEKQAMRALNIVGNKFFSLAFSFLLGQRIKDTLCGTKALLKKTYDDITIVKKLWKNIDPYGDFDLIFGASKLNLKTVEIPIRYKERTYGTSNISRFEHGLLLLRMTVAAARKLKFV